MSSPGKTALSTIGKKFLMALTGLGLVGFVILHLAGNLLLLSPDPSYFNAYSHKLISLGAGLYILEAGLVAAFAVHAGTAFTVARGNRRARPKRYSKVSPAGGTSRRNVSSLSMIWTGLLLLAFLIWHVWEFKYGPGISEGYVAQVDGERMRDLYRLVMETFQNEYSVAFYVGVMLLLGVHVRHGFWSAFQSLGVHHPRWSSLIYGAGAAIALILAIGFLGIPIWIYLRGGAS